LDPLYRSLWDDVDGCDTHDAYKILTRLKLSSDHDPELHRAIEAIQVMEPGQRTHYPNLAEIGPGLPATTWFWTNWIPRGAITILAGWPGIGKTYVGLHLAHCVTSRTAAPDGAELDLRSGIALYVDAEDFLPDLYFRAQTWQMNLNSFFVMQRPPRDLLDFTKPEYQDELTEMCFCLRPDLLVVDSLSMINSRGENSIEEVRSILAFLADIAQQFDTALLLMHHLRKPGKRVTTPVTMHDLRGSGHLVAMARSTITLDLLKTGPDDDLNAPRRLQVQKKNRGRMPDPLAVHFTDSPATPDVAELTFAPVNTVLTAPATKTEECSHWLLNTLTAQGPLAQAKLLQLGQPLGYSRMTIQRAREKLNGQVIDTLGAYQRGNQWRLADDESDSQP